MKKSILLNTLGLYLRQAVVVIINLYVVRVILNELGVVDYGIYNVILGITALLSFIPSAMIISIQRQFVCAIGDGITRMQNVFASSLIIYFTLIVVSIAILYIIGGYFISEYLKIPESRYESAVKLYMYSIFIFVLSIANSLLIALIVAHENIKLFSIVSVIEAILKLLSAFLLIISDGDDLVNYGVFTTISALLIFGIYNFFCIKYYKAYKLSSMSFNSKILKEILSFSSWTLFGFFTSVLRTYAITILLNQWFNPMIVAARVISSTISTQLMIFANNLNTVLYPSLVNDYANKRLEHIKLLVVEGSKISFFLVWVLALPILSETEYILSLWLVNPPSDAVLFARLGVIESLLITAGLIVGSAARATGKIQSYEIILGLIQLTSFVMTFLVLFLGSPAYSVFIIGIFTNLIMLLVKIYMTSNMLTLQINKDLAMTLLIVFLVIFVSSTPCYLITQNIEQGFLRMLVTMITGFIITIFMFFIFGIKKDIKNNILNKVKTRFSSVGF